MAMTILTFTGQYFCVFFNELPAFSLHLVQLTYDRLDSLLIYCNDRITEKIYEIDNINTNMKNISLITAGDCEIMKERQNKPLTMFAEIHWKLLQ